MRIRNTRRSALCFVDFRVLVANSRKEQIFAGGSTAAETLDTR